MVIQDLKDNFIYTPDKKDKWRIMKPEDGKYYGDCEDYALTYLFIESGCSWLEFWKKLITKQAVIQYHEVQGQGHAVLWYNNKHIDNVHNGEFDMLHSEKAQYYQYKFNFNLLNVAWRMFRSR